MTILSRILEAPSYGFTRNGKLYVPSNKEIFREFLRKLDIRRSRKNWLSAFCWATNLSLLIPLGIFFYSYASWSLVLVGLTYSMVALGSHGTFWFHRYCTHRAFRFTHPLWRAVCRNLAIKIIPDETYVISHHVHHQLSEEPGDPYNVHGGWLYCFLADVNHQGINRDLSEKEYERVVKLIEPAGMYVSNYAQYQKWGSLCRPLPTMLHYLLNWSFWYAAFYWMGGHALATAIFGFSFVWAMGVRTFNYDGHGGGKDKRRDGIDFNRKDLSINQTWPGYVSGEWHNNHHLYPNGARAGFLPYQLDIPWLFISALEKIGAVEKVKDYKADFVRDHLTPYREKLKMAARQQETVKILGQVPKEV